VLKVLWEQDAQSLAAIGARLVLDSATMTGLADRLSRDGLVERRAHPDDRRVSCVLPHRAPAARSGRRGDAEMDAMHADFADARGARELEPAARPPAPADRAAARAAHAHRPPARAQRPDPSCAARGSRRRSRRHRPPHRTGHAARGPPRRTGARDSAAAGPTPRGEHPSRPGARAPPPCAASPGART
jgi:hypothetical protein